MNRSFVFYIVWTNLGLILATLEWHDKMHMYLHLTLKFIALCMLSPKA